MDIKKLNEAIEAFLEGDVVSIADFKRRKHSQDVADKIEDRYVKVTIDYIDHISAEGPIDWPYIPKEKETKTYDDFQQDVWKADYVCQKLQDNAKLNCRVHYTMDGIKDDVEIRLYLGDGKEETDLISYMEKYFNEPEDKVLYITNERPRYSEPVYAMEVEQRLEQAKDKVKKDNEKFNNLIPAKNYGEGKKAEDVQVGDILYAGWGYSMWIVDFYRVVERKKASIRIEELEQKVVDGDGMQGSAVPVDKVKPNNKIDGKLFRIPKHGAYVAKFDSQSLNYWDGQPKRFDHLD